MIRKKDVNAGSQFCVVNFRVSDMVALHSNINLVVAADQG